MALAYDATSKGFGSPLGASPLAVSHVCTGSNLLLLVGIQLSADNLTGVTYNSVAMTQLVKVAAGGGSYVYMYGLDDPTTGTNDISVSYTGTPFGRVIGASYTGFLGTLPDSSNSVSGTDTVTSQAITTTTVADNCWFAAMVYAANVSTAITASGGGTLRNTEQANTMFMDSNGALTPPGLKSMTADFNADSSGERAIVGISFSPTAASSPSVSASASASGSASSSSSLSPSASSSASASKSASRSISPSGSISPTASPSASVSRSVSASASASLSPSASASKSASPSLSPSASLSQSSSLSASPSPASYVDKYSTQGNTYTSKYSDTAPSFSDKYRKWEDLP